MANSCLHLSVICVHVKPPSRLHSVQFKSIDFLIDVDHQLYQDATALTLHFQWIQVMGPVQQNLVIQPIVQVNFKSCSCHHNHVLIAAATFAAAFCLNSCFKHADARRIRGSLRGRGRTQVEMILCSEHLSSADRRHREVD